MVDKIGEALDRASDLIKAMNELHQTLAKIIVSQYEYTEKLEEQLRESIKREAKDPINL